MTCLAQVVLDHRFQRREKRDEYRPLPLVAYGPGSRLAEIGLDQAMTSDFSQRNAAQAAIHAKNQRVHMSLSTKNTVLEVGLLVVLSFLWGASFTLIEVAVDTIPPATIVFGRLAIGASLLMFFALWAGVTFPRSPSRWVALLLQGILQSALPFTLISWGQQYIDSSLAGLLNTTPPLFVFLIGFFLLRGAMPESW